MHELLLFGSVPESRHHQVLSVLAGITANSSPPAIRERHSLYWPARDPNSQPIGPIRTGASQSVDAGKVHKKGQQSREAQVTHVIERLGTAVEEVNGQLDGHGDMEGVEGNSEAALGKSAREDRVDGMPIYTIRFDELPDPGIRTHNARKVDIRMVDDQEQVEDYVSRHLLVMQTQYLLTGDQFVYNNILLRLYRVMQLIAHDSNESPNLDVQPLSAFEQRLLDRSGYYVLEASVMLEDGTDAELVSRGTDALKRLKDELEGCVELRAVDRLSLDVRIR